MTGLYRDPDGSYRALLYDPKSGVEVLLKPLDTLQSYRVKQITAERMVISSGQAEVEFRLGDRLPRLER